MCVSMRALTYKGACGGQRLMLNLKLPISSALAAQCVPCLCHHLPPNTGVTGPCCHYASFYMGSGDTHADPHTHKASALPTEQFPQP